jgi:GntR family transcriptional regulator
MSALELHLDQRSGVPYYVQLIHQLRRAVQLGTVGRGEQLPTVREVVARLAVNPNTVLRAYRELEHEGLVTIRVGHGTFVAAGAISPLDQLLHHSLREELAHWVGAARAQGVDDDALAAIFDEVMQDTHERREEVLR